MGIIRSRRRRRGCRYLRSEWYFFVDPFAAEHVQYQYASRDHLLFCIDASESMHKVRPKKEDTDEDEGPTRGKSALHQVLESVVRFEKGKVITGPADSVGLLLFNIDVSYESEPHV